MNNLIIYSTKTGHSKTIAEAISRELGIRAEDIKSKPQLKDVDLLFIAGGIYGGKSEPALLEYLKGIDGSMVKKAVLITSCVSKRMKQDNVREILIQNNIPVDPEEFLCQGNFLLVGRGHPDHTDIENAVNFAKKML